MKLQLESLSTRELQAFGAGCIATFCGAVGIQNPMIWSLIEHQILCLNVSSLPEWEEMGANLELTGRGDPLPDEVARTIPRETAIDFQALAELTTEIGIVDLYGADTDNPLYLARQCEKLLAAHGISPPSVEELFPSRGGEKVNGWGKPLGENIFFCVREWCQKSYRPKMNR